MQNGFCKKNTNWLVAKIERLLELNVFDTVIATRFLNGSDSIYEQLFKWKSLKTADEIALVSGYEKYVDCVFDKYIYTCVNTSFIQKLCQLNDGRHPEKVYLVGVDTDCCVLATATGLFENNIRPVVLVNYCDSAGGSEFHKAGLLCMKRLIGEKQLVAVEIDENTDLESV